MESAVLGIADDLLTEIANDGIAGVKRIYGDWTAPILEGMKVGGHISELLAAISQSNRPSLIHKIMGIEAWRMGFSSKAF